MEFSTRNIFDTANILDNPFDFGGADASLLHFDGSHLLPNSVPQNEPVLLLHSNNFHISCDIVEFGQDGGIRATAYSNKSDV